MPEMVKLYPVRIWSEMDGACLWRQDPGMKMLMLHVSDFWYRTHCRNLETEEERQRSPSVFALNDEEYEKRWRWLLRYAAKIPGVRMAYGQTVFTFPDENKIYSLRIGHDGFTLEESKNAIPQTQKF